MRFKSQQEEAILAATKRIVKNENESKHTASANDEGYGTLRSFVLSASGNRRSRSKTSATIGIEDFHKFMNENGEDGESATNVRRTVSSTVFFLYYYLFNHIIL